MSDEYADILSNVSKSKLKLKTDDHSSLKKKKKKKSKDKDKEREKIANTSVDTIKISSGSSGKPSMSIILCRKLMNFYKSGESSGVRYTKAEMAFKKQQEAIQKKRILDKAKMTHKQKVEKFNEHLDSLSEHFDIQKVSWTK